MVRVGRDESLLPILGLDEAVPIPPQDRSEQLARGLVVVDDQDAGRSVWRGVLAVGV